MSNLGRVKWNFALLLVGAGLTTQGMAGGSQVEVKQSAEKGWELRRNGEPYFILGVGGPGSLALAKELGANSVRFWGIEQLEETDASGRTKLAQIEELGLTFTPGLWV